MPALDLFGRRWALAADDIPVLAFPAAVFHGLWFIFLVVAFAAIQKPSACAKAPPYEACIVGLFVCFFLSCVLEGWLVREGLKGSIFEVEKRKRVVPLIYAQTAVATAEVAFLVLGTVLIFRDRPKCYDQGFTLWHSQGVVDVIVWTTWGVLISMGAVVFITYTLLPQYNSKASWERRCRFLACCLCCSTRMAGNQGGPGTQEDQPDPISRMAELFAQVFEHLDMVTTDILATFLMAAAAQQCKRRAAVTAICSHSNNAAAGLHAELSTDSNLGRTSSRALKLQNSSSRLLDSSSSAASQSTPSSRTPQGDPPSGPHTPRMLDHAREAGLTADNDQGRGMHLLTPSGIAVELRPEWSPKQAAQQQGPHYDQVDPKDLGEASHFCCFAFAAYGYMLFIWNRPKVRGCCELCCGRRCSCWTGPMRRYMQVMLSERRTPELAALKVTNHMNREAIQQMTGLPDHDVVFVRFQNEALSHQCLPYFIAIDEHTNSVVLSIRGTLSLEDCVTDFMCEPVDLDEWIKESSGDATPASFNDRLPETKPAGPQTKASGHSGILESAKAVLEDLQSTGILQQLMQQPPQRGARDCRGWPLVVTGHSLGAGAAVLVALYLRNFFPRVRCWAFSPPGGLADPHVADAAQSFCTSVVMGKDWIPRLTVQSFERLRDEMIMAAVRCKQSKLHFFFGALLGKQWREQDLFYSEDAVKHKANRMLQQYKAEQSQGRPRRRDRYAAARNFVPPGRLMFLRPVKSAAKERRSRRTYLPVWITAQELMAEGVLVSPRMMADHMPDYLTAVLQRLAEQAGQGLAPGEQRNGDFTVELAPSPAHASRDKTDFSRRSSNDADIGRTPSTDIGRRSSTDLPRKGSTDPVQNKLEKMLRNSLATARAYADSEESLDF